MAKPFTTVKLLNGREPLLRHMACEVRFQDGQLYLDHCGRLLKKLIRTAPEWVISPDPTPQGTSVYHLVEGYALSFSMHAAGLDLDKSPSGELISPDEVEAFIHQTEAVLGLILDEVEATEFTRVGYREWYYFSFETKAETEQWLNELGLFSVSPSLLTSFRGSQEALGMSLVVKSPDCDYRIALNGIERSAQVPAGETTLNIRSSAVSTRQKKVLIEALKKDRQRKVNAAFAAVLDIDAYRTEPAELDLTNFVRERSSTNLTWFRQAVSKDAQKGSK